MKFFLQNILIFILAFIVLIGGMVFVATLYMNRVSFKTETGKNILVIGDSHTECAINDSVYHRAVNYSKSATSFVYSYVALRKLVADNPQIDTVLLSFHSSSLSYERERNWIFDETEIARQVPVFLPYFPAGDLGLFLKEPQFYKSILEVPRTAYDYYAENKKGTRQDWIDKHIGNFRDLTWSNFPRDTAATKPLENYDKKDTVSAVMVKYIRKISDFCKQKNITLILINSPVYEWKKYVNDDEFDENRKKFLGDLLFLDYSDFPVADSCRFDIWHLNGKGAAEFSRYLENNLYMDVQRVK